MREKLMLYVEIHRLKKRGFNISQIANELKVSRPTVYKYLEMTFEEADNWLSVSYQKVRKLDSYRDWILAWLEEYPHLSAAQVKDWLIERYPDLTVGDSTVRMYVKELREKYQIEKEVKVRQYQAVPELPMGKQIQVDWGQTKQKTKEGQLIKLYFIAFVLSHSRYKFMWWLDRPFRVEDMIEAHEAAFQYFGGMTEEIVYDQDALVAVSENAGDLILTSKFQQYIQERKFQIYLCRKADPETKGKIENVVKYIKNNFADSRVYNDLSDWNERGRSWLKRTGNHQIHHTTKKRPDEVHPIEKAHLRQVTQIHSYRSIYTESIARNVRKDNTIMYHSNRYSVPIGTYGNVPDNKISLLLKKEELIIYHPISGEKLAHHVLSKEKGKLIQSVHHTRKQSKKIEQIKISLLSQYGEIAGFEEFIEVICHNYPRYQRDQLLLLKESLTADKQICCQALSICLKNKLYSANDLREVIQELSRKRPIATKLDKSQLPSYGIAIRDLSVYTHLLERKQLNEPNSK
ncbi:IS21 family transposase [Vagococcus zengguangii]|uniref:IS21 family transposase n=1 Tax=Vagococcus zengguangii TaxID=2571750 RepID=UPI001109C7C2|nr:IS21 family transposase [Vagococcus zengguangii]TLG80504.1 IS21 family transposase [Vagococcus zengguangii]